MFFVVLLVVGVVVCACVLLSVLFGLFVFCCVLRCVFYARGGVLPPFRPAPGGLRMGRFRVELRPGQQPGTHSPGRSPLTREPPVPGEGALWCVYVGVCVCVCGRVSTRYRARLVPDGSRTRCNLPPASPDLGQGCVPRPAPWSPSSVVAAQAFRGYVPVGWGWEGGGGEAPLLVPESWETLASTTFPLYGRSLGSGGSK